jgi:hypothetical protein
MKTIEVLILDKYEKKITIRNLPALRLLEDRDFVFHSQLFQSN